MADKFDYKGAREAGYSDEEISDYLSNENPNFDLKGALQSGYSLDEINQHLSTGKEESPKQERTLLEKGARVAGQFGLGIAQNALLPYEVAVSPLAIPGGQENLGDLFTREILNEVYPTEAEGKQVNPEPLREPIDIGVASLIQRATGIQTRPEGFLEKAANWTGFIKDPRKLFELGKTGLSVKELSKAIAPTGTETLRGIGAGAALEGAERGEFGPIGTLAALVVGDIGGNVVAKSGKVIKDIITNPRQALAEVASKFTNKDKLDIQRSIIKDFKDSNITADLGTITNSDLIKWVQSRLAQSGLTGKGLDELKDTITKEVKQEYKALADSLGKANIANSHEAGTVLKESIEKLRQSDLKETRNIYKVANESLSENSFVHPGKLNRAIQSVEKDLNPGNLKSTEQSAVLDILQKIKRDITDSEGKVIWASVKDLMNDKIALNDIINYEVQGGSKQLLKNVVSELDRTIISHKNPNPRFGRNYIQANRRFSQHAKEFRNRNISSLLKDQDPAKLMSHMDSIKGIRDLKAILQKTPEGKEIFNSLARLKLDQTIGNNLVDSTTQQLKLGTFSKLLEKGKNRDVIKEILPKDSYKRLQLLQKNSGKLAETAQKFLNTSKSGVTQGDAAIISAVIADLGYLLSGNPWPLAATVGGISGIRYLNKLISDPHFLKLVEDIILSTEKNDIPLMIKLGNELAPSIKAALITTKNEQQ